jgi:acetolactate synthase-1/2/3 large subunit
MGLGAFPGEDPLFLGMLGMHAARYTNMALKEADLLIAFGVRFDDRATGNPAKFCPQAGILHIDIDRAEINKIKKAHFSITADINLACKLLLPYIRRERRAPWLAQINGLKQKFPLRVPAGADQMHPLRLIANVKGMADPDAIITTDVGQHQMWVAQGYCFSRPRSFLTSGGLGTMGFGLPAAIGAALAYPEKQVICFSGDGSLLMNIQELATLADLKPRLKVIVLNNSQLGLVRQQQELFYQGKYIASKFMTSPNFAEIAKNFGIPGIDLGNSRRPNALLRRALKDKGPCLINVPIGQAHNVFPMVAPGGANHEMIGGE